MRTPAQNPNSFYIYLRGAMLLLSVLMFGFALAAGADLLSSQPRVAQRGMLALAGIVAVPFAVALLLAAVRMAPRFTLRQAFAAVFVSTATMAVLFTVIGVLNWLLPSWLAIVAFFILLFASGRFAPDPVGWLYARLIGVRASA